MRDWFWDHEGLAVAIVIVALVVGVIGLCFGGIYYFDGHACSTRAAELGTEHRYGLMLGCRVEVNGRFVPLDNVRINDQGEVIS